MGWVCHREKKKKKSLPADVKSGKSTPGTAWNFERNILLERNRRMELSVSFGV
jgi:hypothetical protein